MSILFTGQPFHSTEPLFITSAVQVVFILAISTQLLNKLDIQYFIKRRINGTSFNQICCCIYTYVPLSKINIQMHSVTSSSKIFCK